MSKRNFRKNSLNKTSSGKFKNINEKDSKRFNFLLNLDENDFNNFYKLQPNNVKLIVDAIPGGWDGIFSKFRKCWYPNIVKKVFFGKIRDEQSFKRNIDLYYKGVEAAEERRIKRDEYSQKIDEEVKDLANKTPADVERIRKAIFGPLASAYLNDDFQPPCKNCGCCDCYDSY